MIDDAPEHLKDPGDLDYGDDLPWDVEDAYDHPDTALFGYIGVNPDNLKKANEEAHLRRIGLTGVFPMATCPRRLAPDL